MLLTDKELQEAIDEILNYSSNQAFSPRYGNFPIQKFKKIEGISQHDFNVKKLNIKSDFSNFPKSENKEIISEKVKEFVGKCLLNDVINKCELLEIQTKTETEYWKAYDKIKALLRNQGLTPLLVLSNPTKPSWVYEKIEKDIIIQQSISPNFLTYLHGIPIFWTKGGLSSEKSLVIAEEAFSRLYKNLEISKEEAEATVVISLKFFIEVPKGFMGGMIIYDDVATQN